MKNGNQRMKLEAKTKNTYLLDVNENCEEKRWNYVYVLTYLSTYLHKGIQEAIIAYDSTLVASLVPNRHIALLLIRDYAISKEKYKIPEI